MLIVKRSRSGTEAIQAELLTHFVSMSLHAKQNILDLRILVLEGHSVDKCVLSHPIHHLRLVLGIQLDAADGKVFDLGEEIFVWLLHSTFVGLECFKELLVQSSCLSLFALKPFHDRGIIGVGHRDSGALGPNELELTGIVELKELLGEGGLGFWDGLIDSNWNIGGNSSFLG